MEALRSRAFCTGYAIDHDRGTARSAVRRRIAPSGLYDDLYVSPLVFHVFPNLPHATCAHRDARAARAGRTRGERAMRVGAEGARPADDRVRARGAWY